MRHNKLREARMARHMTQTDLAYHARVSPSEISKFENDMARPYPAQAARLAAVLGLDADDLVRSTRSQDRG